MKNSGVKDANGVLNYIKDHAGDPNIAAFQAIVEPLSGEVAKATTGGQPNESEMAAYRKIFDLNKTPDQMLATIKSQLSLMGGRIQTNVSKYKKDIGMLPKDSVLDDESQKVLQSMGLDAASYDPTVGKAKVNPIVGFLQNYFNKPTNTAWDTIDTTGGEDILNDFN